MPPPALTREGCTLLSLSFSFLISHTFIHSFLISQGGVSHCREAVCKQGMQRPDTYGTLLGFCLSSSPAPASCRFRKALARERGLNSTLPLTAKCPGTPCMVKRITCGAERATETTQQPREWNLLESLSNANTLSEQCQTLVAPVRRDAMRDEARKVRADTKRLLRVLTVCV